jgi:transposase
MGKVNYSEQIRESEDELLALERKQTRRLLRHWVRFFRLLKSGECRSQAEAGERIHLKLRQSQALWARYRKQGLEALLVYPFKGHKERLTEAQKQGLLEKLQEDEVQTLEQGQQYLEEHAHQHFSLSGVYYLFKRLKVKKKTGRPVHVHRDSAGAEAFKKKPARPHRSL